MAGAFKDSTGWVNHKKTLMQGDYLCYNKNSLSKMFE